MTHVAVIGGGYAGAAFAIHLSRMAGQPLLITVVEPREQVGGGVAYSTPDRDHRLNAPDVIHFLYPDDDLHFRRFLEESGRLAEDPEGLYVDERLYPRRRDFGAYVAAEFAAHAASNPSGSTLVHRRGKAVGIERRRNGLRIELADGEPIDAGRCVIAVRHERAPAPLPDLPPGADRLVGEPLAPGALGSIDGDDDVLVLGTGLTAADTVASLLRRGHRGTITCLSRRGVRPREQNPAKTASAIWDVLSAQPPAFIAKHGVPTSLRDLTRIVREDARARLARGEPWHGSIDQVRDAAGEIWRALNVADKARFQRHLKPYYDGLRFRIPPQTRDILQQAEATGQLRFRKGRVVHAETRPDGLRVVIRHRGQTTTRSGTFGAVVSCLGFATRVVESRDPFLQSCLRQGLARPSDAGRGLESDDAGRVLSADGRPDEALYAIAGMTLDRFGETPAAIFILRQILRMLPQFVAGC
ncbi:MAG: FAD/NAD(P)-binding protein [Gemmatimonadota bacterium]